MKNKTIYEKKQLHQASYIESNNEKKIIGDIYPLPVSL